MEYVYSSLVILILMLCLNKSIDNCSRDKTLVYSDFHVFLSGIGMRTHQQA